MSHQNRPFKGTALKIISINIEGLSDNKESLLSDLASKSKCDVMILQETHRGETRRRPRIQGMSLLLERPHDQYGSAIFCKPEISIQSVALTCDNDIEILCIELQSCTITSVYKPPRETFAFSEPTNFKNKNSRIVIGDFNCRSTAWGYSSTDQNGEDLEQWAENQELKLIHDSKLPASFNSRRWREAFNPDNIFVSETIAPQVTKQVESAIPHTQHRPITCVIRAVIIPEQVPFKRQFNFKKAKWEPFSAELDQKVANLPTDIQSYDTFVEIVKKTSRRHIPRGCRTSYIPGISKTTEEILEKYQELFENDPFSDETIRTGEELLSLITENRREKWCNLI